MLRTIATWWPLRLLMGVLRASTPEALCKEADVVAYNLLGASDVLALGQLLVLLRCNTFYGPCFWVEAVSRGQTTPGDIR